MIYGPGLASLSILVLFCLCPLCCVWKGAFFLFCIVWCWFLVGGLVVWPLDFSFYFVPFILQP
jgi:hypothetical protein